MKHHRRRNFRTCRNTSSQTGFALVESVIALGVMVVGVMPMVALFMSARSLDQQAQAQAAAYSVARQQIEMLAGQKYANRPVSTGTFNVPAAVLAEFPRLNMTGSYTVTSVASYGGASYPVQQIAAEVKWVNNVSVNNGGSPAYSSVRVDTIITREPNK